MRVVKNQTGRQEISGEALPPRVLFASRLAELWEAAGNPTLQRVADATEARVHASRTPGHGRRSLMPRISDWRAGRNVPSRFDALDPVLVTLISLAQQSSEPVAPILSNRAAWRRLWKAASAEPVRPTVTTTLRRDIHTFVGRDAEVQRILDAAQPGRVVSIHTVDGMPGIGKTALVTRAAHLLADRFPDGRFFVELNTHTPGQPLADPADVLATLLTDLGIPPSHIPDSLAARRDLWRDRLSAKRALIVLDDARDHTQIEPLLPSGPGCLALITSRRRLVALDGARPLTLGTLDPQGAIELFYRLAHRIPNPEDNAAVAEIVRLCGYLPLAIVLLAGRLAHRPAWTLTGLAEDFAAAQDRLDELDAGQRAVRAAFTASYDDLAPPRRQLFRRLGLHPGPDFDAHAVAALNDIKPTEARHELEALYTDHLIEETTPGRYVLHDLVREYARVLAAADSRGEITAAIERLIDYYRFTAAAADRWLSRRPRPVDNQHAAAESGVTALEFDDETQALAWMRIERANLLACLEYAADHDPARMVALTEVLAELLEREGPWPFARQLHQRAADAAGRLGDPLGRADALTVLSALQWQAGDYDRAADSLGQALTLFRENGFRSGEANIMHHLGLMRANIGDYERAGELLEQALILFRESGFRVGEANALDFLGGVRRGTGNYEEAAELLGQALVLFREAGYSLGEGNTLTKLAGVLRDSGEYRRAAELLGQALTLFRDTGYRLGEASALGFLGSVRRETGEYEEAADLLRQAAALFREIGHRSYEANVLGNLGLVYRDTGDYRRAVERIQQALALFREIGHRLGEAGNLDSLATVYRRIGDHERAAELSGQALILFRESGYRLGEADALDNLGAVHRETGDPQRAIDLSRQALALFQEIGHRARQAAALVNIAKAQLAFGEPGEALTTFTEAFTLAAAIGSRVEQARAMEGVARCRAALGDSAAAVTELRRAIDLYRRLGVPETDSATAYLAALGERPAAPESR
ncbi:tetratricopeptide repeat protein [Nocardia pseudobrasiliensis]|uniref:Putative ATPase n=1 Tax=Nocardia pseudobrasiliensis TaxID=45979 RepID=A0A370I8G1_9NOCA|nr:tetratricopeptide repeat protein [Nocardia pseudobrasiliensis]RDI66999.1 putative ATPase [Nocardia pseudobrasiliensis]